MAIKLYDPTPGIFTPTLEVGCKVSDSFAPTLRMWDSVFYKRERSYTNNQEEQQE